MSEMIRKNFRITKEQNVFLKQAAALKGTTENFLMLTALENYMKQERERLENEKKIVAAEQST